MRDVGVLRERGATSLRFAAEAENTLVERIQKRASGWNGAENEFLRAVPRVQKLLILRRRLGRLLAGGEGAHALLVDVEVRAFGRRVVRRAEQAAAAGAVAGGDDGVAGVGGDVDGGGAGEEVGGGEVAEELIDARGGELRCV